MGQYFTMSLNNVIGLLGDKDVNCVTHRHENYAVRMEFNSYSSPAFLFQVY